MTTEEKQQPAQQVQLRYRLCSVILTNVSVERCENNGHTPWHNDEMKDNALNLALKASPVFKELKDQKGYYLVCLPITAEYKVVAKGQQPKPKDKTRLLVEVEYSGVFELYGDDKVVANFLSTTAASLLFPYASQTINDLVAKTGCMPMFLPPLDFASLKNQAIKQAEVDATATRQ